VPEEKLVSLRVYDPTNSLFKAPANERATCTSIFCSLESCPVRERGGCIQVQIFSHQKCPYGRMSTESGPTRRAGSFSSWVHEHKQKGKGIPQLGLAATKLAFIGDYVYLPYAHMPMCKEVPFRKHSAFIVNGDSLLPKADWTVENVEKLVAFRPQAMMGGEIASYQKEHVPLFLRHLREGDAKMWQAFVARNPKYDVAPNYVGRKAVLDTLNAPIEWTTQGNNYPVTWRWDGEELTTESIDAYGKTWGKVKARAARVTIVPADREAIEVRDNAWVNAGTEFVD
jgi:hypothetical protein